MTKDERYRRQLAFNPTALCHPKQAGLVRDIADPNGPRNICALFPRQTGKSHGAAMGALLLQLQQPDCNAIYVTSTYATCKRMAFGPARKMYRDHALGPPRGVNLAETSITLPNGSTIYFLGADSEKTIDRLRGTPNLTLCIIDEAGIYKSDTLKVMLEAVRPGLRPRRGKLCVMGTPSLQGKQGTWYDITQNTTYSQHRARYSDNDRVPSHVDVEALIDEDLAAQGYTRESAYFQREYLAEFVIELGERVYQLTDANLVDALPSLAQIQAFVTGVDLGTAAYDAVASIGWEKNGQPWVLHQDTAKGQDSLQTAAMIASVHYSCPGPVVVDPGGLGTKTIMTVQSMYPGIPVQAAIKPPVNIQVKVLNQLLAKGLKILRGSQLAMELVKPTWKDGIVGGDIEEHGGHSDLIPALRYAAIQAQAMLPIPQPAKTPLTEEQRIDRLMEQHRKRIEPDYLNKSPGWDEISPGRFDS